MKLEQKVWTGLGLAGALAGAGLAGCAPEAGESTDASGTSGAVLPDEGGEGGEAGEAGEMGESGEGGVDVARAASDPVTYRIALAVAEAHAIAAYEAFLAGRTDPAAEMFGHPITEVLADMDPVFEERGVADLKPRFQEASEAVLGGRAQIEVTERHGAILAAIERAEQKAPDDGRSQAAIAGAVAADMIERAAAMYGTAANSDRYEPYLDGFGFYRAAASAFEDHEPEILAADPELAESLAAALQALGEAYPGAERPARLDIDQAGLIAASSRVRLKL